MRVRVPLVTVGPAAARASDEERPGARIAHLPVAAPRLRAARLGSCSILSTSGAGAGILESRRSAALALARLGIGVHYGSR